MNGEIESEGPSFCVLMRLSLPSDIPALINNQLDFSTTDFLNYIDRSQLQSRTTSVHTSDTPNSRVNTSMSGNGSGRGDPFGRYNLRSRGDRSDLTPVQANASTSVQVNASTLRANDSTLGANDNASEFISDRAIEKFFEEEQDYKRMIAKMPWTEEEIDRMMQAETEFEEAMRAAHSRKYHEQQERKKAEEASQAAEKMAKEDEARHQAKRQADDDAEKVAELRRTFRRMTLRSWSKQGN